MWDSDADAFEALVERALADLPRFFLPYMENLTVVIESAPSEELLDAVGVPPGETLLGLYEGIPLTERADNEALLLPDVVTLFREPLTEVAEGDPELLASEVRHTVMHEIAHHFGISDERMHEMGVY